MLFVVMAMQLLRLRHFNDSISAVRNNLVEFLERCRRRQWTRPLHLLHVKLLGLLRLLLGRVLRITAAQVMRRL